METINCGDAVENYIRASGVFPALGTHALFRHIPLSCLKARSFLHAPGLKGVTVRCSPSTAAGECVWHKALGNVGVLGQDRSAVLA